MNQKFSLVVDGKPATVDADPAMPLLYALRDDLGLSNPKFGCGKAQCGACTVHVDGHAKRSCVTAVGEVADKPITTIEGLAEGDVLHPVQEAWLAENVPQCGYCQCGQIMTAVALLKKTPHPTDAQIRDGMSRTLCRCMTYYRVQAAIRRVAQEVA